MTPTIAAGTSLLDAVYDELSTPSQGADRALDRLFAGLRRIRFDAPQHEWRIFAKKVVPQHPLKNIIHQDPLTRRCYEKPRGYAGDAKTLDYIYGDAPPDTTTDRGRTIFQYVVDAPASRAVRYRRDLIARMIDRHAETRPAPRVLSLACGHLREAGLSRAIGERKIKELVAVDHDPDSLAALNAPNITPLCCSVRNFFKDDKLEAIGKFDLIYAAGLYDYLSQQDARALTGRMFRLLEPGGSLLVANFLPEIRDVGFMETFMDWDLVYRDRSEMLDVAADIPDRAVESLKLYADDLQNIIFLEICRR